jgi:curved DNA-binding protein CbpA
MRKSSSYYEDLKVSRHAPPSIIKAAYRTLSQEYHPDRSQHPNASEIMTRVNVAYAVLSDPIRRRKYDDELAGDATAATSPPHTETSYAEPQAQRQPESSSVAPERVQRRLKTVPGRLWALAAVVIFYGAWLAADRHLAEHERPAEQFAPVPVVQEGRAEKVELALEPSQAIITSAEHETPRDPIVTKSRKRNTNSKSSNQQRADEQLDPFTGGHTSLDGTEAPVSQTAERYVLQVAAVSSEEKSWEIQSRLRDAGITSYTQKTSTPSGDMIRIRVGPLIKDEAEKIRTKLGRLGMGAAMTPI